MPHNPYGLKMTFENSIVCLGIFSLYKYNLNGYIVHVSDIKRVFLNVRFVFYRLDPGLGGIFIPKQITLPVIDQPIIIRL